MSDTSQQERIEELIRKSLLGEELINTQFHLFSARSISPGRVAKPRVLCANNVLLTKSSKYFLDLLGSETITSDPSLVNIADNDEVPSSIQTDYYGYESQSATPPTSNPQIGLALISDDELSDNDSESVTSEMFVSDPEEDIGSDGALLANKDNSEAGTETTMVSSHPPPESASRLRSLGSRHILVKDTAFQTWYTLVNYLYTGKVTLLPPTSSKIPLQPQRSSTGAKDEPECSAKSMYRLARKVGLDDLRDEAFASMRTNITESNVLQELSCSLVSRYPPILEMLLDTLYAHIASRPVVAGLPALARRIANKELPHGADIVIGLHTRILQEHHPLALIPPSPQPVPCSPAAPPNVFIIDVETLDDGPCCARQSDDGNEPDVPVPPQFDEFDGPRVTLRTPGPPPPFTELTSIESPPSSSAQQAVGGTIEQTKSGGGGGGGKKKKKK
ncbi:hypothetical protein BDN67DRAFT_244089 [Paxillus ammoniavirescens]|nr:hypothetical protein BDN67DRAFT_244089 [Paxillus ammoniavirescens]